MRLLPVLLLIAGAGLLCPETSARVLHQEKSLYRNIVVREVNHRRCLVFALRKGDRNQTCMDTQDPKLLVFPYVRMVFSGLLLNPDPARVLIVGLGGGSIPMTLSKLYPLADIDVVEIDAAVVRVARKYFHFQENDHLKVAVRDARVFIRRAGIHGVRYDLVVLDAFTGDYIPEHLMTAEFLTEVNSILAPGGVLVANTFSTSRLYDHESVTYQQVFGDFINFRMPISGNRVILAIKGNLPDSKLLKARARAFESRLNPYGIEIENFPRYLSREKDWDESRRPLTDQYAPANLLQDSR